MCHQKEGTPQPKYHKAAFIDAEGKVLFPVKVVLPVEGGKVRVYGNPGIVPEGAAWLRFQAVFAKSGEQVL